MDLKAFLCRLICQESQEEREHHLNVKCGENQQDIATDLRASQCRWHHNRGQAIVENVHVGLLGIACLKVVEVPHRSAGKNRKARYSHGWFRVELEKGDEHRYSDTTATDASHRAECHNEAEDEKTDNLERLLREYSLVLA